MASEAVAADGGAVRIADLTDYGIPERIVERWQRLCDEGLLPVQVRAVRSGLLGEPRQDGTPVNLIVSAPTSSGKSFCAEMAVIKVLQSRRRAVLLFPLRALAEQKYNEFIERYHDLDLRCLIVTGDHPESDENFASGQYHVAFAIYEKLDRLLTRSLDSLAGIGLVVIDELQSVAEPGRGALLEQLLTRIVASSYTPTLLGLSAVIAGRSTSAERLADWLGATLVEEFSRPVDLFRGVAGDGEFHYRSYNSGSEGTELMEFDSGQSDLFEALVRHLKASSEQALIFLKSRRETIHTALRVAAEVSWPGACDAVESLADEEPSYLIRSLKQCLGRGVAFHNSDLSPLQRRVVEDAFRAGQVRLVVATTTLAMGVNLPADTVYLETVKYSTGQYGAQPSLVPISRAEFENISGRAGRLGQSRDKQPGRAMVLADSEFDRDILWENYIASSHPEPIESALASRPWEDWLLNGVVCGLISDRNSAQRLFGCTFLAATAPARKRPDFDGLIAVLAEEGMIEVDREGLLQPTALGRAAATGGLTVAQTLYLMHRMESSQPETMFGWTALVLGCPDWDHPPGLISRLEMSQSAPLRTLYQFYDDQLAEAGFVLPYGDFRRPLSYRSTAALKALLLLEQWRRFEPVLKLEERFQLHLGQILSLGESAGHLLLGLAAIIETTRRGSALPSRLRRRVFSLRHGLPDDLLSLHSRVGTVLNRCDMAALYREKVDSWSQLCHLETPDLERLIPGEKKKKRLKEMIDNYRKELSMNRACESAVMDRTGRLPLITEQPEMIEVDGSYEHERYLIRIDGFPVRLTGKSFKYFVKLANKRLQDEAGWVYKEDIEVGFNQARYLYRMKNEIYDSFTSAWPVVENNRLGYYRLNIDPSRIRINRDRLREHPDWEVRSLMLAPSSEKPN
ncbi:MAG TPA: DEAD/DEAH box helicase [candidate division Zixibacteria bacterium]|nr:DEAD/DEAH box helicase [candidate division Zixibacteria bacterium]